MTQTPEPWTPGVHRRCAEGAEHLAALAIEAGRISEQYYWLSVAAVHREADRAVRPPPAPEVSRDDALTALEDLFFVQTFSTGWDNGVTDSTGTMNEGDYWHGQIMDRVAGVLRRAGRLEQRPC